MIARFASPVPERHAACAYGATFALNSDLKQDLKCRKDAQVLPSNAIDNIPSRFEAQSLPLEKDLSQKELLKALTGQSLKTPEGSEHKSKVQGHGGHGQPSDADDDVAVTTPEQMESRWRSPGAAAHSVRSRGQRQRSASTDI
ncbi:MAG: hypothetical protein FRX49_03222 [Trebouxia sp. A1-2]|nr:MAG: hypothetical protein FRX49_03222 [Trebouxia sp. A1-2]